jgi:hypothetical protein
VKLLPLAALLAACGSQVDERETAPPAVTGERPTILLELYTSQGCSSCPPADRLLSQLGREADLIPLAFHVDYWNDIGWRDPFSAGEWTERQRRYARRLDGGRVYTPQLVVQGREHVVGSVAGDVKAALARARDRTAGARIAARGTLERIAVEAEGPASAERWVALVESGLATEVTRGENRGKSLENDFIVRRLIRLEPGAGEVSLALDPAWRRDRLSVAVFLQDPDSLAVLAAARATVDP